MSLARSALKIGAGFFALGAGIETFMNLTGFYDTVVENEAEKRVEFSESDQRKIIAEKYEESLRKLQEKRSRGD